LQTQRCYPRIAPSLLLLGRKNPNEIDVGEGEFEEIAQEYVEHKLREFENDPQQRLFILGGI
jgi:hypothetical protein